MTIESSPKNNELNIKIDRIQHLLGNKGLDAILLRRVSSFAWATCGASCYINTATSYGAASLLITHKARYLLTNNIEAPRLEKEEKLIEQGWEFWLSPWYSESDQMAKLIAGMRLGADEAFPGAVNLSGELSWLRSQLTAPEGRRFRILGNLCAKGMKEVIDKLHPGMTEYQIAALLSQAAEKRGVQAIVNLVATDERVFTFRHPLPTDKPFQRYAMLVLCGRKWGLVCSITRLVSFDPLPNDVRLKAEAVARVDATMILATRPGRTMGEVFQEAQAAYAAAGFPDEWQLHHQGGLAGYEPREIIAIPNSTQPVEVGQAFAWNPSITGTKSEDTILVGKEENEVITSIADWPSIDVQIGSQVIKRPAILEIGSSRDA